MFSTQAPDVIYFSHDKNINPVPNSDKECQIV